MQEKTGFKTKEEIGYDPTHKIKTMLLLNPHEADFTYERPDGTTYVCEHRKSGDRYYIPEMQMEMFPPPKPKKSPFPPNNSKTGQTQTWDEYHEEQRTRKPLVKATNLEDHY